MEKNNYFDELIVSYLSRELNEEEEVFVLDWINSSEENKQYFENLKSAWILLGAKQTAKNINIDSEWNQFKQIISAKKLIDSETDAVSPPPVDTLNEAIKNRHPGYGRLLRATSVVSCIVIGFALTWKLAYIKPSLPKTRASAAKAAPSVVSGIQHVNTTDSSKSLVLQDGTRVLLHPKSEITYHNPFVGTRRDITLIGKAEFTVAKHQTKPFTVTSGELSTTALGTRFTVTAFRHEKSIVVRLYEGKVVVKPGTRVKKKLEDFYLLPGDELVYNNRSKTGKVHKFGNKNNFLVHGENSTNEHQLSDNPSLPPIRKGTWYMFNNQPLNQVYDQLETIYGVEIAYKKNEVSRIYFIGHFNATDSLEVVLKKISGINNLSVIKTNNGFVITK